MLSQRSFRSKLPNGSSQEPQTMDEREGEERLYKVLESKIIKMLEECGENPPLYEDPDFDASNTSLFKNPDHVPDYVREGDTDIRWYRPQEYASDPDYFKCTSGCGTIRESDLDDAWFLGAIAAIASHPDGLIENLFVSELDDFKKYGIYTCRFYKDAQWIEVATDTRLPYSGTLDTDANDEATGTLLYGCSVNQEEVWIPLLEKAYAKLHHGYEALHDGSPMTAFLDCTGGSVKKIHLGNHSDRDAKEDESLWHQFVKYYEHRDVIACQFTQANASFNALTNLGIVRNRLYTVLLFKEVGALKFVKLKNPWNRGRWKGDWSYDDGRWDDNHQIEAALKMDPDCEFSRSGSDSTFWMVWEDFVDTFNDIFVTRLFPESHFQYAVRGFWVEETAAGPPSVFLDSASNEVAIGASLREERKWLVKPDSEAGWFRNPQYRLTCTESCEILISLLQRDAKLHGGDNFGINFLVMEQKKGEKAAVWEACRDRIVAEVNSIPDSFEREISKENLVLDPKKAYVVIPYTDNPKVDMEFFLRIFSKKPVNMQALPSVYRSLLLGEWSCQEEHYTSGGPLRMGLTTGPENASWCKNPQYLIKFSGDKPQLSLKAILRKTSNKAAGMKSKQKDAFKDKSRLVGLTIVKPEPQLFSAKSTKTTKSSTKTNFLGATDSPVEAKEADQPEKKLVVSPDEWCRISDYSSRHTACIYLPKLSIEWAPDGLIVVPTLGDFGVDGLFELEVDSDDKVTVEELEGGQMKSIEGEWSEAQGTAGGCHLHPEWKKNPKFYLRLKTGKPMPVQIKLSRSEKEWKNKCKRDTVGSMMGFYLFQGAKMVRANSAIQVDGKQWSETDFVPMHQISTPENMVLDPLFNEPYVIIPATWEPNQSGKFVLTVKADCQFSLSNEG